MLNRERQDSAPENAICRSRRTIRCRDEPTVPKNFEDLSDTITSRATLAAALCARLDSQLTTTGRQRAKQEAVNSQNRILPKQRRIGGRRLLAAEHPAVVCLE